MFNPPRPPPRPIALELEVAVNRLLVLAAVVLLAAGCRDASRVTNPEFELSRQPAQAALLATDPITVAHADTTRTGVGLTIRDNNHLPIGVPDQHRTHLRVPKFDPTLGRLLSARLTISGWLSSEILSHAQSLGFASAHSGFGVSARLFPDPVLQSLIGVDSVRLAHGYSSSESAGTDCPIPILCLVQRVETAESKSSRYDFDRTYTGTDVDIFVRSAPGDELTFFTPFNTRFFRSSASHSGLSLASLLQLETDPQPGTVPDILDLIRVVASIVNTLNDHGNVSTYSDLHASAKTQFQMQVVYVYQPNRPPVCSEAVASRDEIWPPNHRLVPIEVLGVTDPDGDPITIGIDAIMQDEPTDTYGDGSFTPDGLGVRTSTAAVRAERVGAKRVPGNGRVYHLGFSAGDGRGGVCSGTVRVGVPHDRSRAAVDDGPLYDSTQ